MRKRSQLAPRTLSGGNQSPLPDFAAPGASPRSLLGPKRAEWDGEPISPPFSEKLLALDGTWRRQPPTPALPSGGDGEPPLSPAQQPSERVKLCWAGEASLGALEKGAVGKVVESCL